MNRSQRRKQAKRLQKLARNDRQLADQLAFGRYLEGRATGKDYEGAARFLRAAGVQIGTDDQALAANLSQVDRLIQSEAVKLNLPEEQ